MAQNQLIIFVKAPRPGFVKTRLGQAIGAEAACAAYRTIAGIVRDNLQGIPETEVRFTPDDAALEIAPWVPRPWTASPQGNGGLGQRLVSAFHETFAAGAKRVVIIGCDCPDVTRADIEAAWHALKEHDVVLGPAEDGGYWLIGLRAEQTILFENIEWSTSSVLKSTLAKVAAAHLKVHLLRQLSDIDTIEDLRRFQSRSSQQ